MSQASKTFYKKFVLLILGWQSKFSEALRPKKESSETQEILELGSNINLAQPRMCSIFFQNHSILFCTYGILLIKSKQLSSGHEKRDTIKQIKL